MSTRLPIGLFLAFLAVLAGCQPQKPQSSASLPREKSVIQRGDPKLWDLPDTDRPAVPGPTDPHPTAESLAQTTNQYAKQLEALIAKQHAAAAAAQTASGTSAGATTVPAPNETASALPSAVKFGEVPKPAGSEGPAANPPAPAAADLHGANPNQVASIAPAGTPGVPVPTITQTPPRTDVPFNKDTPAVNTPLIVGQPRPLPATDDMAQRFLRQVKDYPQDVAGQLDWQLLQFLQGQSVPQLQSLAPLPSEDREMLSALLDGMTNFRNGLRADNNMLLSRKIRPLLEMSDRLRMQSELTVPTVALCTDVKGFGVYEPIDPARFEAGKERRVIVYCEVENFASILDEQKRWETKLTQEVVLYTEQNGLEVWRDKAPNRPIIDYSRNRRHDFFIVKMIRLPANLTIGRYLLKVTVVDQQVNRVAENSVPILIVAQ